MKRSRTAHAAPVAILIGLLGIGLLGAAPTHAAHTGALAGVADHDADDPDEPWPRCRWYYTLPPTYRCEDVHGRVEDEVCDADPWCDSRHEDDAWHGEDVGDGGGSGGQSDPPSQAPESVSDGPISGRLPRDATVVTGTGLAGGGDPAAASTQSAARGTGMADAATGGDAALSETSPPGDVGSANTILALDPPPPPVGDQQSSGLMLLVILAIALGGTALTRFLGAGSGRG